MSTTIQAIGPNGIPVPVRVNANGELIVAGAIGNSTSSGSSVVIGKDSAGVIWFAAADTSTTPATYKYFRQSDGTQGTPNGVLTQLSTDIIGQRQRKEASVSVNTTNIFGSNGYTLGAVVSNRAIGTIIGGLFAYQTAIKNGIVKIIGVTFATSNPAPVKAQVDAFAFTDAAPSGSNIVHGTTVGSTTSTGSNPMSVADNTALAIPYNLKGSPNLALLGSLTGPSFTDANGSTIVSSGLSSNIRTDANGKFYVLFALRGTYANILNEVITSSAEWYD